MAGLWDRAHHFAKGKDGRNGALGACPIIVPCNAPLVGISSQRFRVQAHLAVPENEPLYVAWTRPGEWFNLTVKVLKAGRYGIDFLYSSHQGGEIGLELDGKALASSVSLESTANASNPLAWRLWHHWNMAKDIAEVELPAGVHVLTVRILTEGR